MAKVIIHATMTLDGFIAKPDDQIDWAFQFGSDALVEAMMAEIGAVVMGNRGYLRPDNVPFGGRLKVPQFVVTHTARPPATSGALRFTFVDSLERAILLAKSAAGDKTVTLLGASIDQQCLKAGLVDEIVIHLAPVLLGRGIRLFDHLPPLDTTLERIGHVATGGLTSLRFRVLSRC